MTRSKSMPRRVLRTLWRYSLVVTGPIAALFLIWSFQTGSRFYQFGLRFGGEIGRYNLHKAGTYEWDRMVNGARTAVFESSPADETKLRQIHLMINQGDRATLDSHLPASGKDYKDGFLQYPDGELGKVDLRYRGDFPWHWATPKKSWRIKTPRGAMWENMRTFNLVVPKGQAVVEDCLGYWFASEMGLIAPHAELIEAIVNGKTEGIYVLVEQLEETTLRKADRMPGDIFAGELIGNDEHIGIPPNVFLSPGTWSKISINNHFPEDTNVAIVRLCNLLAEEPSEANSAALRELVNIDAFGRFAAFRLLTQTEHFDRVHNWRLYYDPWRNQFEPVVWDSVPWHQNWMPKAGEEPFLDVMFCELDDRLNMEHSYRIATDAAIRRFFDSGLRERVLDEYDRLVESIQDAQRRDPVLNFQMAYVSPEQVARYQRVLRGDMQRVFEFLDENYGSELPSMSAVRMGQTPDAPDWRLALYGRRAIDGLRIDFEQAIPNSLRVAIGYQTDHGPMRVDVSGSCVVRGRSLDIEVPLVGGMVMVPNPAAKGYPDRGHLALQPAAFDVYLTGEGASEIDPVRLSAIVDPERIVHINEVDEIPAFVLSSQFSVVGGIPHQEPRIYSGEVLVQGEEAIDTPVILRPGTKLRMAAGASLFLQGPVVAQGTAEQPIEIVPAEPGQEPWGTFALRGPRANGSVLEHLHIVGGSGAKQPLAEFSAQLSLHHVQDVLIKNCLFEDSQVVDDMVHGVYSKLTFDGCRFVRSLADALDMDISEVTVLRCIFLNSGNDSVDLMTTLAVVEDSKFMNSADKGISIGENSTLFVRNCLFDTCQIGLQSKDESQAAVINSDIVRCVWGVDAYKKNWRYNGGGEIYLYKSRLFGNQETLRADKNSRVGVADSYVDDWDPKRHPAILVGVGMGSESQQKAALPARAKFRFDREAELLAPLGTQVWGRIQPETRGSTFLQVP